MMRYYATTDKLGILSKQIEHIVYNLFILILVIIW